MYVGSINGCYALIYVSTLSAVQLVAQGYAFDMATPEEHRLRISFAKPTKPTDPRSRMGNGPSRQPAYNPADLPAGRDGRSGSRWDSGGGGVSSQYHDTLQAHHGLVI